MEDKQTAAATTTTVPGARDKRRRWLVWLALVVVLIALLVGFRHWRQRQMEQPVYADLAAYLSETARHSLKAQEYLQRYYRVKGRDSVAAQDFLVVCGNVTVLAESEGWGAGQAWAATSKTCRRAVPEGTLGLLP